MTLGAFSLFSELKPGVSLIEASAGTGKTYSIAALVVRLIAELDLKAEQLLVVTFTRAATAELSDRIRARLFEAAAALRTGDAGGDAFLAQLVARAAEANAASLWAGRVERARANLDMATVATIHSFAARVLQWFSLEAGHDGGGEPLDSEAPLIGEVVNDLQLAIAGLPSDPFNPYELRADQFTADAFRRIVETAIDDPRAGHLPQTIDPLSPDQYREALERAWNEYTSRVRTTVPASLAATSCADFYAVLKPTPAAEFRRHPLLVAGDWSQALPALTSSVPTPDAFGLARMLSARALTPSRSTASKVPKPLPAPVVPLVDAGDVLVTAVTRAISGLHAGLIEVGRARFAQRLAAMGASVHSAQIAAVAEAIESADRGPLIARRLRERFGAVLIDEFQDTDALQWGIFERAFAKSAIVRLIGDPKQAIYRFRGADARVYEAAAGRASDRTTMTQNFRSDARLLEGLNLLFDREHLFGTDTVRYVPVTAPAREPSSRLRTSDGRDASGVELRVFDGRLVGNSPDYLPGKTELGAARERLVAADIAALLASGSKIFESGRWRDIRPSDVAVLVPFNRHADLVRNELVRLRIAAVTRSTEPVFATAEAHAVMQLLRTMQHPSRRREVKRLVAGQLFGWSAQEIFAPDEVRWNELVANLRQAQLDWAQRGILVATRALFARHGVETRVISGTSGERSLTNIQHLLELLHRAAHDEMLGPDALVMWLWDRIRRSTARGRPGPDDPAASRLETDDAAVQIMTVHASKGLEFGVVYLTHLSDSHASSRSMLGRRLRVRPDGVERGIWCDVGDEGATAGHYREVEEAEELEEETRKLYVAATRARHRLVVYAGLYRTGKVQRVFPHSSLWTLVSTDGRASDWPRFDIMAPTPDDLERYLREVAARAPDALHVSRAAPPSRRAQPAPTTLGGPSLSCAEFGRSGDLRGGWGLLSFTAMARALKTNARSGIEAPPTGIERVEESTLDRDDAAQVETVTSPISDDAAGVTSDRSPTPGFDALKAGRAAGDVVHATLEVVDFTHALDDDCPADWLAVLGRESSRHGLPLSEPQLRDLTCDLARACRAPIDAGGLRFSLAAVPATQRRTEVEFTMPLRRGGFSRGARTLEAAFAARRGDPRIAPWVARLAAMPLGVLEGMLTGFIDLICAVDEGSDNRRYFVIDYKTNRLGVPGLPSGAASGYGPIALRMPMAEHHYVLQYHLYLVALHRMLARSMGASYDYDRHVGGAAYLFVRGMAIDGAPDQTGIFFDRPPRQTIEHLSAILEGESP